MSRPWKRRPRSLIVERALRRDRAKHFSERAKLEDRVADPRRQNIIGRIEPIMEDDYDA